MKLMAKDPADRYQSAAEMLRDLARVRESMHAADRRSPLPTAVGVAGAAGGRDRRPPTDGGRRPPPRPCPAGPRRRRPAGDPARLGGRRLVGVGRGLPGRRRWPAGWLRRPEDLLSRAGRGARDAAPALWMAPDWRDDPASRRPPRSSIATPSSAPRAADQEAAWLAVPGYFPRLARLGLAGLHPARPRCSCGGTTSTGSGSSPPRSRAGTARTDAREGARRRSSRPAVKALDGDVGGVIDELDGKRSTAARLIDPAPAGAVAWRSPCQAARSAPRTGGRRGLREIQGTC